MPVPIVEPSALCLKLEPAEAGSASLTITKAPTDANISVSIADATGSFRLENIVAFRPYQRPLTEEEIQELPPYPPSIREKARQSTVEELEEIGRSNGATTLSVATGDMVVIVLRCAASGQKSEDVILATLLVEGSAWESVEVPLVLLVGKGMYLPTVEPTEIRRAAEPGETLTQDVVIAKAPTGALAVAFIEKGRSIIRLTQMIAFRPVVKQFTNEEIEELPPFPPSIRENAQLYGYVEYQESARSNGLTPLSVTAGYMVRIYLEFAAPLQNFPDYVETALIIEATTWKRVEIPVSLIIGKIEVELSTNSLTLRHGEVGELNIVVKSVAGPGTTVDLALGNDDGKWRIAPSAIALPKGGVVGRKLQVSLEDAAPTGIFPVGFEVQWFNRLKFRSLPFTLHVKPGVVKAKILQTAVTVTQGNKVTCQVEVTSAGGYKVITLNPSIPPGTGIHMTPVVRHMTSASTVVIPVELTADPQAPAGKSMVGIIWNATDGEHSGALFVDVVVNLAPDSRTFHRNFTTPSGTALGGWAELTIRTDGTYTFKGHMHDSGFDPYAFRINVTVRSGTGQICLALQQSGKVAGTIGSGSRDFDWNETKPNALITANWSDLRNGSATFNLWYDDTGVLGTLEDIGIALAEYVVAQVFVGPWVAGAIVLGSELGAASQLPFLHPTVLTGVFVSGGIVLLLGPGMILTAVAAAALVANEVKARPMRESEKELARKVFKDTLPFGRILITNFDKNGRAFCTTNADGSILVCMGGLYDDPLKTADTRTTLIHELTHAWQIAHYPVGAEIFWQAAMNEIKGDAEAYYNFSFDGRPWSGYGIEHQAVIVARFWYNFFGEQLGTMAGGGLDGTMALNVSWFRYINDNIRMGVP